MDYAKETGETAAGTALIPTRESDYVPGILNPQMHSGSNMDVDNEAFQRLLVAWNLISLVICSYVRVSGGPLHEALPRGIPMAPLWDFCNGQFVGVLSALDFIMIVREAGPDENLKDVALKILQNNVATVPVIHSSSGDASIPQLLHLASLSGILKCKAFAGTLNILLGTLPMLQLPICAIPLGTWVPGIGETNRRPLAMLRPQMTINQALQLGQEPYSPYGSNSQRCHMCLRSDPLHKVMERLANPASDWRGGVGTDGFTSMI
ncbi:hypothetical protein HYC85_019369 [Camellia sinensis]|uniref:CBS domain-containing protein n=1 Tax=Camellia sinensis TaxID=4442 RepID=A0A7J7GMK1_CAMSI|nr:hypothetical protein HYC85_019369 [Camellia sinensis]